MKSLVYLFCSAALCISAQHAHGRSANGADFSTRARAQVSALEYVPKLSGQHVIANNRNLGLRVVFEASGLNFLDRENGASRLRLKLQSFGRVDNQVNVVEHKAVIREGRIELDRGNVREWFVNSPTGIEQGFDVDSKPAGSGELLLHIDTDQAVLSEGLGEGEGVALNVGDRTYSYSKLKAWDSEGSVLPSKMRVSGDDIVLSVDDARAVYPITVDPLLSSTSDGSLVSAQASAQFATDMAGVGDVNGDGYEDIVVTATGFDGTVGANEGGWFLYLGGETVDVVTDGSGLGLQVDARLGSSVAGVGDVNGDGYADFVVGAEFFDLSPNGNEGRAYLYLGGATFNSVVDATFQESEAQALFGSTVSGGDVNGDGFGDIVIAAKDDDGGAVDSGSVYLYLGGASVNSVADATITSNVAGIRLGTGLSAEGDVNADGFADILVGAPEFESAVAEANEGLAILYLGGSTFNTVGDASYQVNQSEARFGESLSIVGDLDGDTFGDMVIGGRLFDPGITNAGTAFVYFGASSPPVSPVANLSVSIAQNNAHFGAKVAAAGDINADGYADFLVGAPLFDNGSADEGAAYVYLGGSTVSNAFYRRLELDQISAMYGTSLAAGDFNGDGYSDVYAGAPLYDNTQTDSGRADIYFGGALNPDTVREAALLSNQASAQLGRAVATGDVNGDGYMDLVTGESGFDIVGGANAGRVLVFFGGEGSFNGSADAVITGIATSRLGTSLAVGDLNGDGYADIVAGAPDFSDGENFEGAVQIHYANSNGSGTFSNTASTTLESNVPNTLFGSSVAITGDINGDGRNDIAVGAPGFDGTLVDQGAMFVYLNRNGFTNIASGVVQSGQGAAAMGAAVSSAGDVNGDGFADFMVGSTGFDATAANAGELRLYHGGPTLNLTADFIKNGDNLAMRFGSCLAHADINGDGFSDIISGAPEFTNGIFSQGGAAFVYRGSSSGVNSIPLARLELDLLQAGARLGVACSGVGDANGDGFGDFLVGVPGFDTSSLADAGTSILYYGASTFASNVSSRYDSGVSAQALAGSSVAGGDLNGDGYADLVSGAVGEDNGAVADTGGVSVYYGNTIGRRLAPRTLDSALNRPVSPWNDARSSNRFTVSMRPYGSNGCEQVKLQVQSCEAGLAFGAAGCVSAQSANWTAIDPLSRLDLVLPVSTDLHHWRARFLYRKCSANTSPVAPRVGPWRRVGANADLSDLRTVDAFFKDGFE
jgi:hypothetical protein